MTTMTEAQYRRVDLSEIYDIIESDIALMKSKFVESVSSRLPEASNLKLQCAANAYSSIVNP